MNRFFIYFSELRQLRTKFKNIRRPDRAVPPRQRLIRLQKPLCRTSHFILEAVIPLPLKELSWSRLLTCIRREWHTQGVDQDRRTNRKADLGNVLLNLLNPIQMIKEFCQITGANQLSILTLKKLLSEYTSKVNQQVLCTKSCMQLAVTTFQHFMGLHELYCIIYASATCCFSWSRKGKRYSRGRPVM